MLTVRRNRQRRLKGGEPLEVVAVLSQAALHQQIGGPEVHRRQLDHILELLIERSDTLQIRVVPFEINPGVLISSSTLFFFDFQSRHLPSIAWQEAVRNLDMMIEPDDSEFRRLDQSWETGFASSLNRDNSMAMIQRIRDL